MKMKILGSVVWVLFMMIAISYADDISTDYDHSVNFSAYKTYSWLKVKTTDGIWDRRTMDVIDSALAAKGLQRVEEGGDLGICAMGMTKERHTLNTFYDSFGPRFGWRWRSFGGFGTATTTVNTYTEGTLVVDIFDSKTKQLIWRGTSMDTISSKPEKNEKSLAKSVGKMFKDFPPGGGIR